MSEKYADKLEIKLYQAGKDFSYIKIWDYNKRNFNNKSEKEI